MNEIGGIVRDNQQEGAGEMSQNDTIGAVKVETLPIGEVLAYSRNPRVHSDRQIRMLMKSMEEYGWTVPILVDRDNNVVAGHGRLEAAARLNIMKIPIIRLDSLSKAQIDAYRVADNRLHDMSTWDDMLLADTLDSLQAQEINPESIGFDDIDLQSIMKSESIPTSSIPSGDGAAVEPSAGINFTGVAAGSEDVPYTPKIGSTHVSDKQIDNAADKQAGASGEMERKQNAMVELIRCPHCSRDFEVFGRSAK